MSDINFGVLEKRLNYHFTDLSLLKCALTHRSASNNNNERLEFLGDSILNFIVAAELYNLRPELAEGDLSRLRSTLVNTDFLAKLAKQLGLGECLILGSGELKSGGHRRNSILADSMEAVYGAVYLDQGIEQCKELILLHYEYWFQNLPDVESLKDPKTRLQEYLQARKLGLPLYDLTSSAGKPHQQVFTIKCSLSSSGQETNGVGSSRRKAEQQAAESMLDLLLSER